MTYEELKDLIADRVTPKDLFLIMSAVEAYTAASNGAKPIVSGLLPFTDVLELNVCIEKLNTKQITLEEFVSDVWNTAYKVGYDMASGNNR